MTTLREFYALLEAADWTHEMSDDPAVHARGKKEMASLRTIAEQSIRHRHLLDAYRRHINFFSMDPDERRPRKPRKPPLDKNGKRQQRD